ncbi:hypothetical protein [Pseudomonas donghuensis]|nr:hypothetical protein [Pseudomonas donghuensis]
MTWTITDTAGMLLLVMAIASTWCVVRGQMISNRRKKEQGL